MRLCNWIYLFPLTQEFVEEQLQLVQELASLIKKDPTDIVFDSTGVKVYGEGEWKVRQHGKGKKTNMEKSTFGSMP